MGKFLKNPMKIEAEVYHHDCFYFSGEKPCAPFKLCDQCPDYFKIEKRILYLHTGALGDIVRQLSLLQTLLEKQKTVQVTVGTSEEGKKLFNFLAEEFFPRVQLIPLNSVPHAYWQIVEFDEVYNLDRTLESSSIATAVKSKKKFGFKLRQNGTIGIFNKEANLIYKNGLDDQEKFFRNKLYADQLMAESMGLVSQGGDFDKKYCFKLSKESQLKVEELKKRYRPSQGVLLGINLGVGKTLPTKRLSLRVFAKLISYCLYTKREKFLRVLLLGGARDRELSQQLMQNLSPSTYGSVEEYITDDVITGAEMIGALDYIITGDTLALHLAMSLDTPCLVWFGPTHPEEIRLNQHASMVRWQKECSPCWKPTCQQQEKCFDSDSLFQELNLQIEEFLNKQNLSKSF